MDIGTIIGLVIAIAAMLAGIVLGGGTIGQLIDIPSIAVVVGGTIGAVILSFPLARVLKIHKVFKKALLFKSVDSSEVIRDIVKFAEIARR